MIYESYLEPIVKPINISAQGDNVVLTNNTTDAYIGLQETVLSPSVSTTLSIKAGKINGVTTNFSSFAGLGYNWQYTGTQPTFGINGMLVPITSTVTSPLSGTEALFKSFGAFDITFNFSGTGMNNASVFILNSEGVQTGLRITGDNTWLPVIDGKVVSSTTITTIPTVLRITRSQTGYITIYVNGTQVNTPNYTQAILGVGLGYIAFTVITSTSAVTLSNIVINDKPVRTISQHQLITAQGLTLSSLQINKGIPRIKLKVGEDLIYNLSTASTVVGDIVYVTNAETYGKVF